MSNDAYRPNISLEQLGNSSHIQTRTHLKGHCRTANSAIYLIVKNTFLQNALLHRNDSSIKNTENNLRTQQKTTNYNFHHHNDNNKNHFNRAFAALILFISVTCAFVDAFSIRDVIRGGGKRTVDVGTNNELVICPTWHPFQCPNGDCIPIKYLCDGSPDCSDEYDENKSMCTAAVRPPVEETAAFLKALLHAHGDDFLAKLFGPKAKNQLKGMGGVDHVAVAISQSPTIEAFGEEMRLNEEEMNKMALVLESIVSGQTNETELTFDEAGDFRFFVQKLQETGFF